MDNLNVAGNIHNEVVEQVNEAFGTRIGACENAATNSVHDLVNTGHNDQQLIGKLSTNIGHELRSAYRLQIGFHRYIVVIATLNVAF